MLGLLRESPLLLLFVVAAVGYLLGRVKVRGFGLGVAAVLFVGLAFGALDEKLKLPELVQSFGLVLFVYTVGLGSGPSFFTSFRRRGARDGAAAAAAIVAAAACAGGVALALGLNGSSAAGLFAGACTNTPALAAVLDALRGGAAGPALEAALAEPVVAYSVAYPGGVLGVLLAMHAFIKHARANLDAPASVPAAPRLVTTTVAIAEGLATNATCAELRRALGLRIVFGRVKRGERVWVVGDETRFERGDRVTLLGPEADVEAALPRLGARTDEQLELDRTHVDFRRMVVSNPEVVQRPLHELALPQRFGAIISRVRRGDVEMMADRDTTLEPGDRVRVVAPRDRLDDVARYLGDSYRALGEIDVVTFSLGITLGLLLGLVPLPMPGGGAFRLGLAGGPLVVGLLLGRAGRTRSLVWSLPYSASLLLRQLGLVMFLAGVGTRAGGAFVATLRNGGFTLLLAGAIVTFVMASLLLTIGHRVLRIPSATLLGVLAGAQTQPAALAFASEQAPGDQVASGYATVFPFATLLKIVLAQGLLLLLRGGA